MDTSANAEVDRLASGAYVSLTTFKRDGTAVATPVWVSHTGDRLYVWTEAGSGKVKRVRNDGRVLLAPSDARGRPQGAHVEGSATVLDAAADVARVASLHRRKYGLQFRAFDLAAKVFRRGSGGQVAIEITVP